MKAAEGEINTADDGSNLDFAQNDTRALHDSCEKAVHGKVFMKKAAKSRQYSAEEVKHRRNMMSN